MHKEVANYFEQLHKSIPDWEDFLGDFLGQPEKNEYAEFASQFWPCINSVCNQIRIGKCTMEDVLEELKPETQKLVEKILKKRLRPFFACEFIRVSEDEMHIQIQSLIDEIWKQNVIRYNPNFSVKTAEYAKLAITEETATEFSLTLAALVDHCVSKLLSYEGTVAVIEYQTGISEDLAEYIARRIERDSDELRVNYLIKSLSRLSG